MRGYDHKERSMVALKVFRNGCECIRQGRQEVKVLKLLKEKDLDGNGLVVHYKSNFVYRGHMCIVMELLGVDLYRLML